MAEIHFRRKSAVDPSAELPVGPEHESGEVLEEVLDVLGSELDTSWFWQLAHASGLFLIFVLAFRGLLVWDGVVGNLSGFVSGILVVLFTYLVLFYHQRRYTIRQIVNQLSFKRPIRF